MIHSVDLHCAAQVLVENYRKLGRPAQPSDVTEDDIRIAFKAIRQMLTPTELPDSILHEALHLDTSAMGTIDASVIHVETLSGKINSEIAELMDYMNPFTDSKR